MSPGDADPHVLAPGTLPTPFTAEEIRAGCPVGRFIRTRIEADGRIVGYGTQVYLEGDAEGATTESQRLDADGVPSGPPETEHPTWLELQAHASFDSQHTGRSPEVLETPLGRLDCLHYQRQNPDGSTSDFWFALSHPGMPIRFRTVKEGRVSHEVIVIEDTVGASAGS
jgi:hypothetical protein